METELSILKKENRKLRELLWLNHGCPVSGLYGDDGELQCSNCVIDFKRTSPNGIEVALMRHRNPEHVKVIDALTKMKEELCNENP